MLMDPRVDKPHTYKHSSDAKPPPGLQTGISEPGKPDTSAVGSGTQNLSKAYNNYNLLASIHPSIFPLLRLPKAMPAGVCTHTHIQTKVHTYSLMLRSDAGQ